MRLREASEIGYLMMQIVGAISMPHVTRDAQKRAATRERLRGGRRSGKKNAETFQRLSADLFSEHPALDRVADLVAQYPEPRAEWELTESTFCPRCSQSLYFGSCTNCDVDGPEPTVTTFSTTDGFWWLSYANDVECAGIAVVRLEGEQSMDRAVTRARVLGLEPEGEWQIAGTQFPEEERALGEAHADRFLTRAEAETIFQAQAVKTWEAEHPGEELDTSEFGVTGTPGHPEQVS